jgi:hypothetical protein
VRRRILLTLAGVVVVAGIATALLAFPTRSGCDDGMGAPSADIPISLCSTPRPFLPMRVDSRGRPRAVVIGVAAFVALGLIRVASDERRSRSNNVTKHGSSAAALSHRGS